MSTNHIRPNTAARPPPVPKPRTFRDPALQTLAMEFITRIKVLEAFIDALIAVGIEREKEITFLQGVLAYTSPTNEGKQQ